MKVIAIDFDGTLCENEWPDIGAPHVHVILKAKEAKENGAKLILWTCREGDKLKEAVDWCAEYGLFFDAVNDNVQENKDYYGDNPRKVSAHEYWDDRAVICVNSTQRSIIETEYDENGALTRRIVTPIEDPASVRQSMIDRVKGWWKKWRSA